MKQCPKCGTNYTDDTLRFCLSDGAPLPENDEQATLVRPHGGPDTIKNPSYAAGGQMRVEIPQAAVTQSFGTPPTTDQSVSWVKIVAVVGVLAVMIIAAAGLAGALIYFNKDARPAVADNSNRNGNRSATSPSPTPATSPTASNSETNNLKEQIANLEKRLNEQGNSNRPAVNTPAPPEQPTVTRSTAVVNSPGDGFLALRSLPSSSAGDRVYAIPHGARVSINGCLASTRIGNKTGRWCRASYGGYSGWVFDAWLIY